jgi:hypothetical protein
MRRSTVPLPLRCTWNRTLLPLLEHLRSGEITISNANEDEMKPDPIPHGRKAIVAGCSRLALLIFAVVAVAGFPGDAVAQGQPVQNGPMFPIALVWVGAAAIGLALVYGILRNRTRTRAEKQVTEQATKDLYAAEDRKEKAQAPRR